MKIDLNARPVVFPNLASTPRLMAVIGSPRDVPDEYNRAYNASMNRLRAESLSTTSDPIQIAGMLQQWFFRGLQVLQVKLNPEVTQVSEREFKHFLIEVPNDTRGTNPNAAVMRCHWNLVAGVYKNARFAEVYDCDTAEVFAQFRVVLRGGCDVIESAAEYDTSYHKDPVRRTSIHALFHDLALVGADTVQRN